MLEAVEVREGGGEGEMLRVGGVEQLPRSGVPAPVAGLAGGVAVGGGVATITVLHTASRVRNCSTAGSPSRAASPLFTGMTARPAAPLVLAWL